MFGMRYPRVSLKAAFEIVKVGRGNILPRMGFQIQLSLFERTEFSLQYNTLTDFVGANTRDRPTRRCRGRTPVAAGESGRGGATSSRARSSVGVGVTEPGHDTEYGRRGG